MTVLHWIVWPLVATLLGVYIHIAWITTIYHRGFSHRALHLSPWFRPFAYAFAPYVTGIEVYPWVIMHRLHHKHSDEEGDPHSPHVAGGAKKVFGYQFHFYRRVMKALRRGEVGDYQAYMNGIHPSPPKQYLTMWGQFGLPPYVPFIVVGFLLVQFLFGWMWAPTVLMFGLALFSHPVTGYLVNTRGHARSERRTNGRPEDHSINDVPTAIGIGGEGYQRNHHARPSSANFAFAYKDDIGRLIRPPWYHDWGYHLLCRPGEWIGLWTINRKALRV